MKKQILLYTLAYAAEEQNEIFSIDFHPDGTRFLTTSDKISIWKSFDVNQPLEYKDLAPGVQGTSIPMFENCKLAEIRVHNKAVNCARFSPNGKFIAAGSDDRTVSISYLKSTNNNISASDLQTSSSNNFPEEWAIYRVLTHHSQDVFGVEWSPDSNFVASCSVDNYVVIYDLKKDKIVKRLQLKGTVKGISWDPIGRFLVAQTENSLSIYQTSDWSLIKETTELFRKPTSSLFLHPSWTADGQHVIIPNTCSKAACTASSLKRGSFDMDFELRLTDTMTSVIKCSPVFFESTKSDASALTTFVAIGGSDKSIYVWSSNASKPIVILRDVLKGMITDACWTPDGRKLIACCRAGSVILADFSTAFPKVLDKESMKNMLREKYGELTGSSNISEYPSVPVPLLDVEKQPQPQPPMKASASSTTTTTATASISKPNTTSTITNNSSENNTATQLSIEQRQKETKSKDGKRRITPVMIGKASSQIALSSILGDDPTATTTSNNTDVSFSNGTSVTNGFSTSEIPVLPNIQISTEVNFKKRMLADEIRDENNTFQKPSKKRNTKKDEEEEGEIVFTIGQQGELLCTVEGEVSYFENGTKLWSVFIGEKPTMATGNSKFIAIASEPCSIHVFSKIGRRIFPTFILTSPVKYFSCSSSNFLCAVGENLDAWVWDIIKEKIVTQCTVDDLLARYPNPALIQCDYATVTEQGALVVIMSTGESFSFNENMKTWFCVADAHAHFSPHLSTLPQSNNNSTISLRTLRSKAASIAEGKRMESESSSRRQAKHTKEDVETALAAAASIGDKKEYLHFLSIYVKYLCGISDITTLREFYQYLIGVSICGMQGKEILKFVLHAMTSTPAAQRLANEIREAIKQS